MTKKIRMFVLQMPPLFQRIKLSDNKLPSVLPLVLYNGSQGPEVSRRARGAHYPPGQTGPNDEMSSLTLIGLID